MYSNEVQRGVSYSAERRRAFNLQTVRDEEEVTSAIIEATGRLTQRTIASALAVNLVAYEVEKIDPGHGQQYEALAVAGIMRLARVLTGD